MGRYSLPLKIILVWEYYWKLYYKSTRVIGIGIGRGIHIGVTFLTLKGVLKMIGTRVYRNINGEKVFGVIKDIHQEWFPDCGEH